MEVDIAIAQKLEVGGDIAVKETLSGVDGISQTATGPILIKGDIRGVQVRSAHDVLVEGAVVGEMGRPCRIDAEGDVMIVGQVQHAQISARNIRIGGEVRNAELTSFEHIAVESDLIDVDIVAGSLTECSQRARKHQRRLAERLDKLQVLRRQLDRDEVRLHKQCDRTSAGLDFSAAGFVLHTRDRIRVDLSKFYLHVADKGEEEVNGALKEFFAKGIIGLVSRNNRAYIAANSAHEKVFVQLIQSLRSLVFLARNADLVDAEVRREREALAVLARQLNDCNRGVAVRGKIYPDTTFRFAPREVDIGVAGELLAVGQPAELKVAPGADASRRVLARRGADGREESDVRPADELRGVALRLDGGRVVWAPAVEPAQKGP